jgi:hypothetical protein
VSINVWRLAGDTLNITCNFSCCNHQVHRDFVIILYISTVIYFPYQQNFHDFPESDYKNYPAFRTLSTYEEPIQKQNCRTTLNTTVKKRQSSGSGFMDSYLEVLGYCLVLQIESHHTILDNTTGTKAIIFTVT